MNTFTYKKNVNKPLCAAGFGNCFVVSDKEKHGYHSNYKTYHNTLID
jgi:hypothetical protein